jgi:O-antigen/teichoic acid export membrane protein
MSLNSFIQEPMRIKSLKLPSAGLVKNVYIYFGAYFFNAGLSFLTISLLTRYLSPTDYGVINLYTSFTILLMPFISVGIISPLSVEFYKKTPDEYRQFFTNSQGVSLISLLFFSILCFFLRHPLSQFLRVTPIWIIVLPVTVWWIMNNEITMMMCRMKNRPWWFAWFCTGRNIFEITLTLILVVGLHWAWQGRLLSAAVAPTLMGIISIYIVSKWQFISKSINWKQGARIAWVCIPFVFERLTIFVLGNSDKYFIDKFDLSGTEQVGLYSVGAQIASIINLVILSMNSAYLPYLYQNLADGHKERAKKGTGLYVIGAALMVGVLFLIIPLIFNFFIGHRFSQGRVFAYYLCSGSFMWAIYNAFLGYLLFHGKNRQIFFIALTGMLVSVLMNFILVPRYGAYGAAVTNIITYTFMAVISIRMSWRYFKS